MKRIISFLIIISIISLINAESKTQNVFLMTNYGSFDNDNNRIENSNNITGKINIINNGQDTLFNNNQNVTATLNQSFGIEYICQSNKKKVLVEYKYYHPIIENPNTGKSSQIDSVTEKIPTNKKCVMGWKFNEKYELQKGEWKFQIIENDKVVLEQIFYVQ
jgi:hypothetical protein